MQFTKVIFPIAIAFLLMFMVSCSKNYHLLAGSVKKPGNPGIITNGKDSIVYADVAPDTSLFHSSNDSFYLDLDKDGVADFVFTEHVYDLPCSDDLLGLFGYYADVSINPTDKGNAYRSSSDVALALDSASLIAQDSTWTNHASPLVLGPTGGSGRCIETAPRTGHWINVAGKYLGLKIRKGINFYYGWARMTSTFHFNIRRGFPPVLTSGKMVLQDYAYNAVPFKPIAAGQAR
jgi:hypothetical protein